MPEVVRIVKMDPPSVFAIFTAATAGAPMERRTVVSARAGFGLKKETGGWN